MEGQSKMHANQRQPLQNGADVLADATNENISIIIIAFIFS